MSSVDLCWLIMTCGSQKNWIWPLLSKKTTFYCTLNLTHFSNFDVILTPSCDQTFMVGLDLTCSSFRGLNFDDFPFFCFHNRTSRSRVSLIQRFRGNCGHLRNLLCGAVQPAAGADDDYHDLSPTSNQRKANATFIIIIIIIIVAVVMMRIAVLVWSGAVKGSHPL